MLPTGDSVLIQMRYACCVSQRQDVVHYDEEEEEDEDEPQQEEEDSDEAAARPTKRRRMPVPHPSAGTPAKAETLEEVEQRLQPGSVKHAIFQVCSLCLLNFFSMYAVAVLLGSLNHCSATYP